MELHDEALFTSVAGKQIMKDVSLGPSHFMDWPFDAKLTQTQQLPNGHTEPQ